eukprot:493702-Prorocentrum_minimum.AAC.2
MGSEARALVANPFTLALAPSQRSRYPYLHIWLVDIAHREGGGDTAGGTRIPEEGHPSSS